MATIRRLAEVILVLSLFLFASTASATIYKWVDERGVMHFTDDAENIPPGFHDRVEEVNIPPRKGLPASSQASLTKAEAGAQPGKAAIQTPSISQSLIREGDFAIDLAQALKLGSASSEAEAESILVSAGIAPRNGWIADYPLTPDIIGELQDSIGEAADSGRLAIKKDAAIKAFQDLTAHDDLPLRADNESRDQETEAPRDGGEYSNPTVINNYYYEEGPPVVTYYPPPTEYRYLYAWVPYPFWCSRFWFPGFFILHDFHKATFVNRRAARITNHFTDPRTKRVFPIDPISRRKGGHHQDVTDISRRRGPLSPDGERGASAILHQRQNRARPENSGPPGAAREQRREASPGRSGRTPRGQRVMGGNESRIRFQNSEGGRFGFRGDDGSAGRMLPPARFVPAPKASLSDGGSSRAFRGSDSGSGGGQGGRSMGRR
jgi:hypothetical protein